MSEEQVIDSTNIGELLNSFKEYIDNDTILYLFENMEPLCISREYLYKNYTDLQGATHSLYIDVVQNYKLQNTLLHTYYKNKDGFWVDLDKLKYKYNSHDDIYQLANSPDFYKGYTISTSLIPSCQFTDKEGRVHPIIKGDGSKTYEVCNTVFINEKDPTAVKVSQYNIDMPTAEGVDDHLKNDIRIEFLQLESIDNILIWINGMFMDWEKKVNDPENVIYVRDAKRFLTTLPLTQDEDGKPIYYYNFDLRVFKWKDVNISQVIPTRFTKTSNLVYKRYAMSIVDEVWFEEDVNPNAHMIFVNGQILSKKQYKIDPNNPKHIYLTTILDECMENIKDLINNSESLIIDPFIYLAGTFKNRVYTLVNFTAADGSKLFLERVLPLVKGFPSRQNFLFREIKPKDLICVNGFYFPYLLTPNLYIEYPIEDFIFMTDSFGSITKNCDVYKIEFYKKSTLNEGVKVDREDEKIPLFPNETQENDGFQVDFPRL